MHAQAKEPPPAGPVPGRQPIGTMSDLGVTIVYSAGAADAPRLEALNDQLYQSCVTCHRHYRPSDGRRREPPR